MKMRKLTKPATKFAGRLQAVLVLSLVLGGVSAANSQPITCYSYFTDRETTRLGEILPFEWASDSIVSGTVRSNDSLSFVGRHYSVNRVISSRGISRGDCEFAHEPAENEDQIAFPRWYNHLQEMAQYYYYNEYKYIVRGRSNRTVQVYIYNQNEERLLQSISLNVDPPVVLFFGSDVDVEGVFRGSLTIVTGGDIGLIGDVRYYESDTLTGEFNNNSRSYLGLVAGDNIIIRNTLANGRENGFGEEPRNSNRHSIIINGSLIALGGSFTFENQNEEDDEYQGPSPDERGTIYFKGSLAQRERGYLHRGNNQGTGYRIEAQADSRLEYAGPPGFNPRENQEMGGYYDRLVLGGRDYVVDEIYAVTLVVEAGTTISLVSQYSALFVGDSLIIMGTERRPVRIRKQTGSGNLRAFNNIFINHAIFEEDVHCSFQGDNIVIRNCSFDIMPEISGTANIDSCSFGSSSNNFWSGLIAVNRSMFDDCTVAISERDSRLRLNQCTIVGGNGYGVDVKRRASAELVNSIIAFGRYGVRVDDNSTASIRYCNVSDNTLGNFIDCVPGEGTFSADPLLEDVRRGDFALGEGSPCIDAGDPVSPRDPDGTRADVGAFWLDRGMGAGDPPFNSPPASKGGKGAILSASPNPFNATTVIRFEGGIGNPPYARLAIYDLAGREVFREAGHPPLLPPASGGENSVTWDATAFPAGIYVVRVGNGKEVKAMKIVKVD